MSNKGAREDLRVKKTYNALITAMITLLNHNNFKQITVNDICEEALVSRATFYSHFNDKYDLLKYLSNNIIEDIKKYMDNIDELKAVANEFTDKNLKILKNIFHDANNETLNLLHKMIESIIEPAVKRKNINQNSHDYIILINFCVGGLSELLLWKIRNGFSLNFDMVDEYLYKMIENIMVWDAEYERSEAEKE